MLVSAPRPNSDQTPFHFGDNRAPLGLGYLAEFLRANGHEAKIIDLYHFGGGNVGKIITINSEVENSDYTIDLWSEIEQYRPDYIGFYVGIISYYLITDLVMEVRKRYPEIKILAGGPHISSYPESLLDCFDSSIIGEGEYALLNILNGETNLEKRIDGISVSDLDSLPLPNYDDFVDKPYNFKLKIFDKSLKKVFTINSTRGCPFECKFCCVGNRRFRSLSPIRIIHYIEILKDKYGIDAVYFREDNFTVNNERVKEFCDLMIKHNINLKWACETRVKNLNSKLIELMAKSGFVGAYIGVESGSDRMLEYMQKGETTKDFLDKFPILHANGIQTYTTWIYNLPTETPYDRRSSKQLVEKLSPNFVDDMVFLAIPGSSFYDEINKSKEYEFKEKSGIIYYKGFLDTANIVWKDDRCKYVSRLYEKNNVQPYKIDF